MALAERLSRSPAIDFCGVLAHAGHSYACSDADAIRAVARSERDVTVEFAERLRRRGIPVPEVSIGSTPTMSHATDLTGVTEVRPGNYVFYDAFQAAIGSCTLEDAAFSVLTTIVGHYPEQNKLIVDAGALALSKDPGATHVDPECGYGAVFTAEGSRHLQELRVASLSQEHGQVRGTRLAALRGLSARKSAPHRAQSFVPRRRALRSLPRGRRQPRGRRVAPDPWLVIWMRLVLISDTHERHAEIDMPPGDVLVHAGDFTMSGDEAAVVEFDRWLGTLSYRWKIVIAGNHDFLFEQEPERARRLITNATYLQDEAVEIEGVRFWGSPWQPWFYDWAFNLPRGEALVAKWKLIPTSVDVLITHGPPAGILDRVARGENVGCADLMQAVRSRRPRLHVFGHIHEAYGSTRAEGTTFVNACTCDFDYRAVNPPIVVEVP